MALRKSSIYGTGLSFPFTLDSTRSKPKVASEETLVKMSMRQILLTGVGERPHLTKNGIPYGTRFRHIMFENFDAAKDIIEHDCARALDVWEPRIIVLGVTVSSANNGHGGKTVNGLISFRYRSTNRVDNFVVPFRHVRLAA